MSARASRYIPDRGHYIWLEFTPQSGHEQGGHRPALVISPVSYNSKVGLALLCPITSKAKGYPFEVNVISTNHQLGGVILADQVKSLDWRARHARFISTAPDDVVAEVIGKIQALLR